jgi:hypothetical protein
VAAAGLSHVALRIDARVDLGLHPRETTGWSPPWRWSHAALSPGAAAPLRQRCRKRPCAAAKGIGRPDCPSRAGRLSTYPSLAAAMHNGRGGP